MAQPWSPLEVRMIIEHYPVYGPHWCGWEDVLPNRTANAIRRKANAMGIKMEEVGLNGKVKGELIIQGNIRTPDPMEPIIMNSMKDGMTPSEIDREMHWPRGRAVQILTERWARLKGAR